MASMELSAEDAVESMAPEPYVRRYAVGELYISGDGLGMMGMADPLKPGTMVRVMGTAKVMSSALDCEGEKAGSLCIQITDLDLRPQASAKAMFPKSAMED